MGRDMKVLAYLLLSLIAISITFVAAVGAEKSQPYAVVVITPQTVEKYAIAGNGTPENPYIIRLGKINARGYTYGIVIANISNVILRDTIVVGAAKDNIRIINCTNVTLLNVTSSNTESGTGIYIFNSSKVKLEKVSVSGSGYWGIGIANATYVTLERVSSSFNQNEGIFAIHVKNLRIVGAHIAGNGKKGMYIMLSENISIENVQVYDSRDGDSIKLERCSNVVVKHAKLVRAKYWNLCLMGVTNAYIYDVYTTGAGWDGLYIGGSKNVTVSRCTFYQDTYKGVFIEASYNVKILNSTIMPIKDVGINMKGRVMNVIIKNNIIMETGNSGIRCEPPIGVVRNILIVNNTIMRTAVAGIDLACRAQNVTIVNNTIVSNKHNGIYIYKGSSNIKIMYNTVCNNTKNGIKIKSGVSNVEIAYNYIAKNGLYAIFIESNCKNIRIHDNKIVDNGKKPQAYDDSGAKWYHNIWSDYIGKGPYTIAGKAGARDENPVPLAIKTTTTSPRPSTASPRTSASPISTPTTPTTPIQSSTSPTTSPTSTPTISVATTQITARQIPMAYIASIVIVAIAIAIAIAILRK